MAKNVARIPEEYQEVTYIAALNTLSYVSSGISARDCKSAYIRLRGLGGYGTYGAFGSSWSLNGFVFAYYQNFFSLYSNGVAEAIPNSNMDGSIQEFEIPPTSGSAANLNQEVRIFNVGSTAASIAIYSLIFYGNNGEVIADFIPCYRKADAVCGLYDMQRGIFCAGYGSFTYG